MDRKKLLFVWLLLLTFAGVTAACGTSEEAPASTDAPAPLVEQETAAEEESEFSAPVLRADVPRITAAELKERLDAGEAIVIADTRPLSSFDNSHIEGAISVPDYEVDAHLDQLPLDQEIVFYCT